MSKFNIAVLISGNGSNLQALIDEFKSNSYINICCVISNQKEAHGLKRAYEANIDTHYIDHKRFTSREEFENELITNLEAYKPDLIVLAGFMRILSSLFVKKFLGKLINIHPSLLPKYKGLDTHRRVIEAGEKFHGVTVHFVDNTLDGGPICAQSSIKVTTDNIKDLQQEIHKLEHKLYPEVVSDIANKKISLSNGKVIRK